MPYSSKFNIDGIIRVGSLMLTSHPEGHTLQRVVQIEATQIHMREFEPGQEHPLKIYTYDQVFFPIPLTASQLHGGQHVGSLWDLQQDPFSQAGPDFTTLYYPAVIAKSQKGIPKGSKALVYHNQLEGTKTPAVVPLEAYLNGEVEPFPTCIQTLPVNDAHIRASLNPDVAAAASSSSSSAAAASSSSDGVKLTLRKPGSASPAIHRVSSPARYPDAAAASSSSVPTPAAAVASTHDPLLGKRKRDDESHATSAASSDPAASAATPATPSSAPGSPSQKKQKLEGGAAATGIVKEKKKKGDKSLKAHVDEAAAWHFDLPADPATIPLGLKWTLDSLTQVMPIMNSMILKKSDATNESKSNDDSTTATSTVVKDEHASASTNTSSSLPAEATTSEDHPFLKSLEVEFANWRSIKEEQQHQQQQANSTTPSSSTSAATSSSALPADSSFIAFRSALGEVHYYDRLKRITQKQLIAAPYVLDYLL